MKKITIEMELTDDEHAAFTGWCDKLRVSPAEFAWVALTGEIESMGDKSMREAMVEDVLSRFDGDWRPEWRLCEQR